MTLVAPALTFIHKPPFWDRKESREGEMPRTLLNLNDTFSINQPEVRAWLSGSQ